MVLMLLQQCEGSACLKTVMKMLPLCCALHSTAQHSTAQHSTAQHGTAQHSTAGHGRAQHKTALHSTHADGTWSWCDILLSLS